MKKCLVISAILALSACASQSGWQMRATPQQHAISGSLTKLPDVTEIANLTLTGFPSAYMPQHVRPCCAFGDDQSVALGNVKVPFFQYSNTLSLDELGAHSFDAGTISLTKKTPKSSRELEKNGMMYTLRGGFLDTAHIRDTADNTVGLFYQIFPKLGQDAKIAIPDELGTRYIQLSAFDVSQFNARERWKLSAHIAAYMSFVMAQAHEIAQWHGYRSFAPWPETISAFSPEDLYSNMLGSKVALSLLLTNLALTQELYEQHFTSWLYKTIKLLEPLSKEETNQLFKMLDGHWWDSSVSMPNKYMVLKRDYHIGTHRMPLLVPNDFIAQLNLSDKLSSKESVADKAISLNLEMEILGQNLSQLATMYLQVDAEHHQSFKHIPQSVWLEGFTNQAFQVIAEYNKDFDQLELNHQKKHLIIKD